MLEEQFDEDSQGIGIVKIEPHFEDSLDGQSRFEDFDAITKEDIGVKYGNDKSKELNQRHRKRSRQSTTAKQKKNEFEKLFSENMHRFDMLCDLCPKSFHSFDEAKTHYAIVHNNRRGYIKCCNLKFFYRCNILKHLYFHLEKYKCNQCEKVCRDQCSLEMHSKKHFKSTNNSDIQRECYICDLCKKAFSSKMYLRKHLRTHFDDKKETDNEQYRKFIAENFDLKCDQCDTIFTTYHDARRHYKEIHNEMKGYIKCCKMKLNEYWLVIDHINSHLNPSNLKCEICNKFFADRKKFYLHKRRHDQASTISFTCDYCGRKFRSKETIRRHLFVMHIETDPKFECDICHKRFQLKTLLRNHQYSVHREKKANLSCEFCGKMFNVKAIFEKHMLLHGDKTKRLAHRKQCDHCGEWLLTKSGLYYHEVIHKSDIQKCGQCGMELPHKLALSAHIRKNHREPKHKCKFCDKSFDILSKLREHEDGHTRQNVYPCSYCSRAFTIQCSRQTHEKRNHPQELQERKKMRKLLALP